MGFTRLNPSCSIDPQRKCFCFNSTLGRCLVCQQLEKIHDPGRFPASVTFSFVHSLSLTLCFSVYTSLYLYLFGSMPPVSTVSDSPSSTFPSSRANFFFVHFHLREGGKQEEKEKVKNRRTLL